MRIHNLYADETGASHFRDLEIEWMEDRGYSQLSETMPATGIIFRRTVGSVRKGAIKRCRPSFASQQYFYGGGWQ